jgi:antitoxin component YwqK of YwqJK toxin-antitoxin module
MKWDLFAPNRKDGEHVSHYPKGFVREKRNYLKGKLHGTYESYYENGQLLVRMSYLDGQKSGEAVSY